VLAYLINLSKFSLSLFMDQGLSEEKLVPFYLCACVYRSSGYFFT
jgi:hypothetical protein